MKILRVVGLLIGVSLAALLIHRVGWISIRETLQLLGWKYVIVLVYPFSWVVLNTMGWRYACDPSVRIPLSDLIAIRLAGETFNSMLPSGFVGGEPVKMKLLSRWTSLREAASSVLIAKAAQSIGLLFFIGLGLVFGLPASATPALRRNAWLALIVLSAGVGTFTLLLANQSFSRFGRALHRLTGHPKLQALEPRLLALDDSLGKFYREHKGRFMISVFWQGVGWLAGMMELVLIFHLIGHPIPWRHAWFMGALAQLGAVIGLMSPAGVGFYEGGHYMAAMLLGMPPSLGVSISLIRRMREVFVNGVGLIFFWKYSKKTAENGPVSG